MAEQRGERNTWHQRDLMPTVPNTPGTPPAGGPLDVPVEEVAGTLAARQALGEEAEDAIIREFLDRSGRGIDARVEARLAEWERQHPQPKRPTTDRSGLALAIVSILAGVPLTGIAVAFGDNSLVVALAIWTAIVLVNLVYNSSHRR
jgi:Flp pilus assembly protein TadB